MELSVWYNLNHHSFKTDYKQRYCSHEVGEINKFNHLLIQNLNLDPPKPRLREKTADKLENLAHTLRYGKRKKTYTYERSSYPWWYRR